MPDRWINYSPGDLSVAVGEIVATPVDPALKMASGAQHAWASTPLDERTACLLRAKQAIEQERQSLALLLSLETGKPIVEATAEVGAVVAKFDLTIADARDTLVDKPATGTPHPSFIRRLPRGVAAVIAPFNFPLHLGHGANVAYLVGGNTVIFKPSPYAANVAAAYARIMSDSFPPGVFNLVQGGADEAITLCSARVVRSVCFTGSAAAGKAILRSFADDLGKDIALELGGKNAALITADADLALAARDCADAVCLTAGQRCNATTRIIVDRSIAEAFTGQLLASLARYAPGDPLEPSTLLGPLISAQAVERYARWTAPSQFDWMLKGEVLASVQGKKGHYVRPAVARFDANHTDLSLPLHCDEVFAPVAFLYVVDDLDMAVRVHDSVPYGLTTSVYTTHQATFDALSPRLYVGNLYANLPTTFSPSTLPFGGLKESGNRHPGGRGFVRFVNDEQVVQTRADAFLTDR